MLNFIKKSIEKYEIEREIKKINRELDGIHLGSENYVKRFCELVDRKVELEMTLERM